MNEPITDKSKCIKCMKEISTKEFLKYDHRCKECNLLPNHIDTKKVRCTGCKHTPHLEKCNECIQTSGNPYFKPEQYCGCEVITQ